MTGFDIDLRKIKTLTEGDSYIVRILPSEIQQARSCGFEATSDYARLAEVDAIIICVPTPLNEYREPDLKLHHGYGKVYCAASARGSTGSSRGHNLSRRDRRGNDPYP